MIYKYKHALIFKIFSFTLTYLVIIFLVVSCGLTESSSVSFQEVDWKKQLRSFEQSYALHDSSFSILNSQGVAIDGYDSSIFTIAAGLASRTPERNKNLWKASNLFLPEGYGMKRFYPQPFIKGWQKRNPISDVLVIMLGSSFSKWETGTWQNQVIEHFDKDFTVSPSLLGFSGFLTDDWLGYSKVDHSKPDPFTGVNSVLPLSGQKSMEDFYWRLVNHIKIQNNKYHVGGFTKKIKNIGIIGYSGGARLVFHLLSIDAQNPNPIFNMGGIAYNPILDLGQALKNLDGVYRDLEDSGFEGDTTLGGYVISRPFNKLTLCLAQAQNFGVISKYKDASDYVLDLLSEENKSERSSLIRAFLADFTSNESARISKYVGLDTKLHKDLFQGYAFELHKKKNGWVEDGESFSSYTAIKKVIDGINSPLYVVFPQDDPVLSNPYFYGTDFIEGKRLRSQGVPSRIQNAFKVLQKNPHIHLFSPKRGGHMGYFLDKKYVSDTLKVMFEH